jgi:hypothetical protein
MTKRVCQNCRWFVGEDLCFRYPKENATGPNSFCGEWSDASITPEQEEMRELTRRFAVAIMSTEYAGNLEPDRVWSAAESFAEANPRFQKENKQ